MYFYFISNVAKKKREITRTTRTGALALMQDIALDTLIKR